MTTKLAAPTVLKKIFDRKIEEVAERRAARPMSEIESAVTSADPTRGFRRSLADRLERGGRSGDCRGQEGEPKQGCDPR